MTARNSLRLIVTVALVTFPLRVSAHPVLTRSVPAKDATLWTTAFGRTLLVKLALLGGVAGVGAYNWRRVRPALGRRGGAARLRTSAMVELGFATLVVMATAVLVATPTPMLATP